MRRRRTRMQADGVAVSQVWQSGAALAVLLAVLVQCWMLACCLLQFKGAAEGGQRRQAKVGPVLRLTCTACGWNM